MSSRDHDANAAANAIINRSLNSSRQVTGKAGQQQGKYNSIPLQTPGIKELATPVTVSNHGTQELLE
jgi:hypothetical protein